VLHHADPEPDPDTSLPGPFAFPVAGQFLLQLTFSDKTSCSGTPAAAVVNVQVVAPTGDDLTVWNSVKTCFECAALLHDAVDFDPDDAADQSAVALLRDLAKRYPRSRYASEFRKTLSAVGGTSHQDDDKP
jgi:hypothetical protein